MGEQQEIPEVSYNKDYFFDIFGRKVLTKDIFKQYASKVDISTSEVIYDYNETLNEIEKECFHVWHIEYNEDPNLDYTFSNYVYWDVPLPTIRCSRDERDQDYKLIELAFQTCKDIFSYGCYLKNKDKFVAQNLPVAKYNIFAIDKKDLFFHEINTHQDYISLMEKVKK